MVSENFSEGTARNSDGDSVSAPPSVMPFSYQDAISASSAFVLLGVASRREKSRALRATTSMTTTTPASAASMAKPTCKLRTATVPAVLGVHSTTPSLIFDSTGSLERERKVYVLRTATEQITTRTVHEKVFIKGITSSRGQMVI